MDDLHLAPVMTMHQTRWVPTEEARASAAYNLTFLVHEFAGGVLHSHGNNLKGGAYLYVFHHIISMEKEPARGFDHSGKDSGSEDRALKDQALENLGLPISELKAEGKDSRKQDVALTCGSSVRKSRQKKKCETKLFGSSEFRPSS